MNELAPFGRGLNAYTLTFDPAALADLQSVFVDHVGPRLLRPRNAAALEGNRSVRAGMVAGSHRFFVASYDTHPLLWVSGDSAGTHRLFTQLFEDLGLDPLVRRLVDHERRVMLYCGFFVVSDRAPQCAWHADYEDGANGYTLLTPLFELDPSHGNLLVRGERSPVIRYRYKVGEAIIAGDRVPHSTEPYATSRRLRVLVSLTFGTDKLEYWPILEKTVGAQSRFLVLPCGHERGACRCVHSNRAAAARAAHPAPPRRLRGR